MAFVWAARFSLFSHGTAQQSFARLMEEIPDLAVDFSKAFIRGPVGVWVPPKMNSDFNFLLTGSCDNCGCGFSNNAGYKKKH